MKPKIQTTTKIKFDKSISLKNFPTKKDPLKKIPKDKTNIKVIKSQVEKKDINSNSHSREDKNKNNEIKLKFVTNPSFDTEKFIKTITDEVIKCIVCKNLISDSLSCYKCNQTFCKICILKELEEHSKCPACYNIIFPEMLLPIDIQTNEFFKNKEFICPFNRCQQLLNLNNVRTHLDECIFNTVSEEKKQHITKIIYLDQTYDPVLKTHMLNYLKNTNSSNFKFDGSQYDAFFSMSKNLPKSKHSPFNKESDYDDMNAKLKQKLDSTNDHMNKIIYDLAKLTKITNEKLKNMINC